MNLLNLLTDQIPHTSSMKEFIIHLNINVIILLTLESFIPISKRVISIMYMKYCELLRNVLNKEIIVADMISSIY